MKLDRSPRPLPSGEARPFDDVAEVIFWFVQAQEARAAGARVRAGLGLVDRPCEPLDVLAVIDRLYRQRRLGIDHVRVLAHYGRRLMPPDPDRALEVRAFVLWQEALDRLRPALLAKGILADPCNASPVAREPAPARRVALR